MPYKLILPVRAHMYMCLNARHCRYSYPLFQTWHMFTFSAQTADLITMSIQL